MTAEEFRAVLDRIKANIDDYEIGRATASFALSLIEEIVESARAKLDAIAIEQCR